MWCTSWTALRLLAALEERSLVEQNADRGKYQLGFGILRLASDQGRLNLATLARPLLDELAAQLGKTVDLAVLREHYAVTAQRVGAGGDLGPDLGWGSSRRCTPPPAARSCWPTSTRLSGMR